MDPQGNAILDKNGDKGFFDKRNRKVNKLGYLIDSNGNVIDQHGKLMFEKNVLDDEGEIPKVFRGRFLRSDSDSDLSLIMNQIDEDNNKNTNAIEAGSQTSFESQMEESPTKYNQLNQRYTPRDDTNRDSMGNDYIDRTATGGHTTFKSGYENQF